MPKTLKCLHNKTYFIEKIKKYYRFNKSSIILLLTVIIILIFANIYLLLKTIEHLRVKNFKTK